MRSLPTEDCHEFSWVLATGFGVSIAIPKNQHLLMMIKRLGSKHQAQWSEPYKNKQPKLHSKRIFESTGTTKLGRSAMGGFQVTAFRLKRRSWLVKTNPNKCNWIEICIGKHVVFTFKGACGNNVRKSTYDELQMFLSVSLFESEWLNLKQGKIFKMWSALYFVKHFRAWSTEHRAIKSEKISWGLGQQLQYVR